MTVGAAEPAIAGPGLARRGFSLRLAGDPAHGLLFTGYLLAEAALLDRRSVSHAPTLGARARGFLSGGAVRIAADPEEYPLVDAADCLLLTSPRALERFASALAPGGWLLVEDSLRDRAPDRAIVLPLVETAMESSGTSLTVDLVAASALAAITAAVSRKSLYEAAERLLPARGREASFAALDAGVQLGKSLPPV